MSAKDIINVELVRKVNRDIMERGVGNMPVGAVRSEFLGRTIPQPERLDAQSINAAWKKVREQSTGS